jgi:hypothetical protein
MIRDYVINIDEDFTVIDNPNQTPSSTLKLQKEQEIQNRTISISGGNNKYFQNNSDVVYKDPPHSPCIGLCIYLASIIKSNPRFGLSQSK